MAKRPNVGRLPSLPPGSKVSLATLLWMVKHLSWFNADLFLQMQGANQGQNASQHANSCTMILLNMPGARSWTSEVSSSTCTSNAFTFHFQKTVTATFLQTWAKNTSSCFGLISLIRYITLPCILLPSAPSSPMRRWYQAARSAQKLRRPPPSQHNPTIKNATAWCLEMMNCSKLKETPTQSPK